MLFNLCDDNTPSVKPSPNLLSITNNNEEEKVADDTKLLGVRKSKKVAS